MCYCSGESLCGPKTDRWRPLRPCGGDGVDIFPESRSTTPGAFMIQVGAEPSPGYRLRRVRGRGGFAEVWEADSPTGPVALKFMPSSNTATTARELRSIQSFQSLDHPYLVRTNGVWSVPGYIVIDMELADATLLDLMLLYHNDLGQHIPPDGAVLLPVASRRSARFPECPTAHGRRPQSRLPTRRRETEQRVALQRCGETDRLRPGHADERPNHALPPPRNPRILGAGSLPRISFRIPRTGFSLIP